MKKKVNKFKKKINFPEKVKKTCLKNVSEQDKKKIEKKNMNIMCKYFNFF